MHLRTPHHRDLFTTAVLLAAISLKTVATWAAAPQASEATEPSKHVGTPELASIGALTFSPDGVLFLADSLGARLFAVEIDDETRDSGNDPIRCPNFDEKAAALLGTTPSRLHIGDMAVHPTSQRVYLSVTRGAGKRGWGRIRGDGRAPVLLRVDKKCKVEDVVLEDVRFSSARIFPAPEPNSTNRHGFLKRTFTVLEVAYIDGDVYLSGLSNEEFSSRLRRISYPFKEKMASSGLEIFHTAHGRYETHAPINAFAPYQDDGETKILGAFSCTPLVTFPLEQKNPAHVKGTTVAELGAGNHPLDIISYAEGDETYFLLANHLHSFMKIDRADIVRARGLNRPTNGAGAPVKKLPHRGIIRLAELNGRYVAALQHEDKGEVWNLISLEKGSL